MLLLMVRVLSGLMRGSATLDRLGAHGILRVQRRHVPELHYAIAPNFSLLGGATAGKRCRL